jgi:hypothetical protein
MIIRLILLLVIGVVFSTVDGFGQNTWLKTYGGYGGKSIISTSDGGFVLTGSIYLRTGGEVNGDIFVMKINSVGDIVWKSIFGGSKNESGYSITTSSDGGFVLTGLFESNDGDFNGIKKGSIYDYDIFVIKLNSNGNIEWKKTFGGSRMDWGYSITTTSDGGFVLTGFTVSNDGDFNGIRKGSYDEDIFVLKINSVGDIVWKSTFGGSNYEEGSSITTTSDGGFVLTGFTESTDGDFNGIMKGSNWDDIFVLKLNSVGNIVWKKTFGGSDRDFGYSITTTLDGGFVLTGFTNSPDGDFNGMNKGYGDIFVIKLNSNGEMLWKSTFGGSFGEEGSSITTTSDGGFVLTGQTDSYDGDFKGMQRDSNVVFVIRLNSIGNIVWKKTFGGSRYEEGSSITTTLDGGFVLTGQSKSNDGDFSSLNKGVNGVFVMKLDSNGNLDNTTSINEFNETTTTLSIHPNPFHNSTTVSYKVETPSNVRIELLNTLGQIIEVLREDYIDIGTYQLPLNVSTLSSGMYSVRMISGSMNEVVPVCVVR